MCIYVRSKCMCDIYICIYHHQIINISVHFQSFFLIADNSIYNICIPYFSLKHFHCNHKVFTFLMNVCYSIMTIAIITIHLQVDLIYFQFFCITDNAMMNIFGHKPFQIISLVLGTLGSPYVTCRRATAVVQR